MNTGDIGGKRKHLFIINPKSFLHTRDLDKVVSHITAYFKGSGIADFVIHVSCFPRDAVIVIRKYIAGVDNEAVVRVYAVGGDGIAFDCLNGIIGIPNTELALVPYGAVNDFVRAFGAEHSDLFRNIPLQVTAPSIPTDVIHCGKNHALNFCTIGMESSALLKTLPLNKRLEKYRRLFHPLNGLLYAWGGILSAFDKSVIGQGYCITADGKDISGCYNGINIANGAYYGSNKSVVPAALPNDGQLDMLIMQKAGTLRTLWIMVSYLNGKYYQFPAAFILNKVKKVTISSETPLLVCLDGEAFFDTDITVEILPKAVNIVAVKGLAYQVQEAASHGQ
ncbi:MAG: hypothetical protein LBT14_09385 [Treponema sp.]|jgi:YegS/Rv2252/BmrU family lipid kinase|nr:hypothetical protein [Treponema sp.]